MKRGLEHSDNPYADHAYGGMGGPAKRMAYGGGVHSGEPCPYFPRGTCERGDMCKFTHIGPGGTRPAHQEQAGGGGATRQCPYFMQGTCEHGSTCKWAHDPRFAQVGGGPAPCPYFPRGTCDRGNACRFSHAAPLPSTVNPAAAAAAASQHFPVQDPGFGDSALAQQSRYMSSMNAMIGQQFGGGVRASPYSLGSSMPMVYAPQQQAPQWTPTRCPYFAKGQCTRGNTCSYSHAGMVNPNPQGICPYFSQGKCERGASCSFAHVDGAKPPCPYYAKGQCERGDDCKFSHNFGTRRLQKGDKPCPYFLDGRCQRGDNCNFRHHDNGLKAGVTRPCPYFLQGTCNRGKECRMAHIKDLDHQPHLTSDAKPCPYFKSGACEKGMACMFLHTEEVPALEESSEQVPDTQ